MFRHGAMQHKVAAFFVLQQGAIMMLTFFATATETPNSCMPPGKWLSAIVDTHMYLTTYVYIVCIEQVGV